MMVSHDCDTFVTICISASENLSQFNSGNHLSFGLVSPSFMFRVNLNILSYQIEYSILLEWDFPLLIAHKFVYQIFLLFIPIVILNCNYYLLFMKIVYTVAC